MLRRAEEVVVPAEIPSAPTLVWDLGVRRQPELSELKLVDLVS